MTPSSASATSINVTVPNVPAGSYRVRARNDPDGESNSAALKIKSDVDD